MQTLATLAALLVGSSLIAQTVWTVPDGHFVDPYVAQASPGDILLLGGNHQTFVIDKALTIIGRGTDPLTGTTLSGLSFPLTITAPVGDRVVLVGLRIMTFSQTGQATQSVVAYTGRVSLCDVAANQVIVLAEDAVLQRVVSTGGASVGGISTISDCELTGRDIQLIGLAGPVPAREGLVIANGARVVASNVTIRGGRGDATVPSPNGSSRPALVVSANASLWLSDSVVAGGDGGPGVIGGVAISSSGSTSIARTTVVEGINASGTSFGYQIEAAMVGISSAAPRLGQSFQVIATAGASQELLGILAGFDATANVLAAPFVEPVFGSLSQLVPVALGAPAAGAQVSVTIAVPGVSVLLGAEVWFQAVQLAGADIRASSLAGGVIH